MVRGRRKCARGRTKAEDSPTSYTPKRKDLRPTREAFKGKLSHSSPQPGCGGGTPITRYFQPLPSPAEEEPPVVEEQPPAVGRMSPRKHGAAPQGAADHSSPSTPHKIQLAPEALQLTPSTALSQLCISVSPKKATKSRRRLNPSQAVNQQAAPKPRPTCCAPVESHKLTEYFPVRRSVRKTKQVVLEERQRSLEAAILSAQEEGLEVHNFEGKGRGVVATRNFHKGEFVVEYAGELIDMADAREREQSYAQDQNTGCYMYYFKHRNDQYCIDATAESGRLGRLVNHSRSGNLVTKTVPVSNLPRLVLIAREDIGPGEEVTYDYGDRSKESIRFHPWLNS